METQALVWQVDDLQEKNQFLEEELQNEDIRKQRQLDALKKLFSEEQGARLKTQSVSRLFFLNSSHCLFI